MYWYFPLFVIIFLTHPGVIFNPFETAPVINAFYQMFWVWILNLPSLGSNGLYYSSSVMYYIAFGVWAYITYKSRASKISLQ